MYLYTADDKKPTSDDIKQVRGIAKANQGFPTAQRNINDIMSNLEDEDKSITGLYLINVTKIPFLALHHVSCNCLVDTDQLKVTYLNSYFRYPRRPYSE